MPAANLTHSQLRDEIDWERGEANAAFANPTQVTKLLNLCNKDVLRRPELKTIRDDDVTIAFTGSATYALDAGVKSVIGLQSGGPGISNPIHFEWIKPEDYHLIRRGYCWTVMQPGQIEIFATDVSHLPTATLTIIYNTRKIILGADGVTKQTTWIADGDTSRLPPEYDAMWVSYAMMKILRREGRITEYGDEKGLYEKSIESLIFGDVMTGPVRGRQAFGHYRQ